MVDRNDPLGLAAAIKRANVVQLPKRFYKEATFRPHPNGFAVVLDGKSVRSPGKAELVVPREDIADAMAAEWAAQGEFIDPKVMPVTRLVNSALDGVAGREAEVAADCLKYAGSDLLCYRADFPDALVALQLRHWDRPLAWAETTFDCRFVRSVGVGYVEQPATNAPHIAAAIAALDAFQLAGLHSMTTMMGSVLLSLAVAHGQLDAAAAWTAAHVDEDFQISQWGEDAEACSRRQYRWRDMQAAALLVVSPTRR